LHVRCTSRPRSGTPIGPAVSGARERTSSSDKPPSEWSTWTRDEGPRCAPEAARCRQIGFVDAGARRALEGRLICREMLRPARSALGGAAICHNVAALGAACSWDSTAPRISCWGVAASTCSVTVEARDSGAPSLPNEGQARASSTSTPPLCARSMCRQEQPCGGVRVAALGWPRAPVVAAWLAVIL
jgi:hypothetical protein